jgi:hypothetical protein
MSFHFSWNQIINVLCNCSEVSLLSVSALKSALEDGAIITGRVFISCHEMKVLGYISLRFLRIINLNMSLMLEIFEGMTAENKCTSANSL